MLWESSKMEQRCDAVLGVIRDGSTVTGVAHKFGVKDPRVPTSVRESLFHYLTESPGPRQSQVVVAD
jgi:hypothetical protein